jgi:endogenous inhibitor of DNA gyrase (YacG/DUF329 family)
VQRKPVQWQAMHCAHCQKPIAARADNPAFPFCTERCRSLDLGKWLDEDYKVSEPITDLTQLDEGLLTEALGELGLSEEAGSLGRVKKEYIS